MSAKHPHAQAIDEIVAIYATKDAGRVRRMSVEAGSWFIPGHHRLAGKQHGVAELLALFDDLAKANFQAKPIAIAIALSGHDVVDHHDGWSDVAPRLDIT